MNRKWISGLVVAIAASALSVATVVPAQAGDEQAYIITVPDGQVQPLVSDLSQLGETPDHVYTQAVDGVAVSLTDAEVASLKAETPGISVTPDLPVSVSGTQSAATWGISALDQATLPADSSYTYPDSAGQGVDVFVIDTGVGSPTTPFPGTVDTSRARDFSGSGSWYDCHGHGTHVAGTIASQTYGVAKRATIIPLRVLDCSGSGSTSNVIAAINYAMTAKTPGKTAVMNLSLGGGFSLATNNAINSAVDAGIVAAVAAGNDGVDACFTSPASATKALTVGALDNSATAASFSNYGSCVDVYAPGVNVTSLTPSGGTATWSGTSMATPHAAGVAALYVAQNPSASAATATAAIVNATTTICVTCSPNKVLNIQTLVAPETTPVAPGAPGTPTAATVNADNATINWTAPSTDGGATIDSYSVQYKKSSATSWTTVTTSASTTSLQLSGLTRSTAYSVRVAAHNSVGLGAYSSSAAFTTLSGVPTAPRNVAASIAGTTATVSWNAPASTNGSPLTSYVVEYKRVTQSTWTKGPTITGNPLATTATITGLGRYSGYQFRVTAKTAYGQASATSAFYAVTAKR